MVDVRQDENIVWHQYQVDKTFRANQKQQQPCVLWFTGLSGSGKSTIAGALESRLVALGYHTYLLDGDNVRHALCKDLGFSSEDRRENIRRIGEVAHLMLDAGLIVLAAFVSPYRTERLQVKEKFGANEYIEVFVDTSLAECEKRDPKGLYRKARNGQLKGLTGIDSGYEVPLQPDIHLLSDAYAIEDIVEQCMTVLLERKIIN